MEPRSERGICPGVEAHNNKCLIGHEAGDVAASHHIKKREAAHQWDIGGLTNIKGTPWKRKTQDDEPGSKEERMEVDEPVMEGQEQGAPEVRKT